MGVERPLEGMLVLDFSQFLAGPLAGLKLADLGARVIKIENPTNGDLCRYIYLSDTEIGGVNSLFQAINRNKESFCANLKNPSDREQVFKLVRRADIVMQNFRPGVVRRLGFDYPALRNINPDLIYGSISGYGDTGPWVKRPGQDLLAQALSGLTWLSGNDGMPPTPMGLAVGDILAGNALVQGLLAAVIKRARGKGGSLVETSLLEVLIDVQFEVLTTYLNNGRRKPRRSSLNNAHAYLSAPYGIYRTADGYIAIAMGPVDKLGGMIGSPEVAKFSDSSAWFERRDEIKGLIQSAIGKHGTAHWMAIFSERDVWASEVLEWDELLDSEAFNELRMLQQLEHAEVDELLTTRLPIRIDGEVLRSPKAAPRLGEHTADIAAEFRLES